MQPAAIYGIVGFRIRLAIVPKPEQCAPRQNTHLGHMPSIEALIVDDSMSARFALNRSLQALEITADQAKTGEEGVEIATQKPFDIIFMDHVLPGINGLQAMEQIRESAANAHTPIVMCTSNDDADYRAEATQRGANDVLCKPPDTQAISKVLDEQLLTTAEQAPESEPRETAPTPTTEPTSSEAVSMNQDEHLKAIDERLDRMEAMLQRLETSIEQMDKRSLAMARAIADRAGKDLSNRLLRAVLTLKGK